MTPEERARLICSEFVVVERRHWIAILANEFRLAAAEEREACAKLADDHPCQHGTTCAGETDVPAAIRRRA